jgi:hypothetical protein
MNGFQSIARQTIARFSRSLLILGGVAALAAGVSAPAQAEVKADPGDLKSYRGQIGQSVDFTVTGRLTGNVWGTDVYTDDSNLGPVAVHAGILRDGQQGVVRVTILAGQTSYTGSTRNGVSSMNYGSWYGSSYRVAAVSSNNPNPPATTTGSFHAMWSTDLGLYLGLVQTGNQVKGYYWSEGWYPLLTGTVTGNVLAGRWDVEIADGTFKFTLAPDGRGFDAEATGLYGMVQLFFKGGLYSPWQ